MGYDDELIGEEVEHKYDSKGNLTETIKNNASFNTHITTTKENDSKTITHFEIKEHQTSGDVTLANLDYTYNYDESIDNNLTSITLPNGTTQNIYLDKLGRTKEIINGNFTKQYSYLTKGNHTSNLISAEWFGKDNIIRENLHYSYDEKGNITEIKENGKLIAKYTYDALSRLVREDNAILNKTITISYDAGGNILNKSEYNYTLKAIDELEAQSSFNYDYRSNGWKDQLMSYNIEKIDANGIKTVTTETFRYDPLGNPEKYREKKFDWDYGRRLVSYSNYTYEYNANGIRVSKAKKISDELTSTTHYFTNGTQILGQYDGNLMLFYYGVDGVIGFSVKINEETSYYTYKKNILGDIIGIYDSEGNEIARYTYDAWGKQRVEYYNESTKTFDITEKIAYTEGEPTNEMVAVLNPLRYRGYYYDYETGLYYLNSRYYDPETGRFINADDVSILNTSKDEINGLNLYAYCFNNPINDTDANGNWSLKKFFKSKVGKILIGVTVIVVAAGLTVATAGGFAVAGAAFAGAVGMSTGTVVLSGLTTFMAGVTIGAITGSLIGAFVGGLSSWASGGNILDGIADGFMWGAISGAISGGVGTFNFGHIGDFGPRGQGNVFQVMCQTAISLGSYIVPSIIKKEQITILGTALSLFGGITGGLLSNSHMLTQVFVSSQVELLGFLKEVWKRLWNISDNNIVLYVN